MYVYVHSCIFIVKITYIVCFHTCRYMKRYMCIYNLISLEFLNSSLLFSFHSPSHCAVQDLR